MAYPPSPVPVTDAAFLADRQRFWEGWCSFATASIAVVVALLALMGIFLV